MKKKKRTLPTFPTLLFQDKIEESILGRARRNNQIIYGARAIQKQIGIFSRPTVDFDIFSSSPEKDAQQEQAELDKIVGFDYFYSKKGVNPGTWKVKSKGKDGKKGTPDDEGIVDYTKTPSPKPKVKKINGIYYRNISEEIKGKKAALRDPQFAFRHAKDREDLQRIRVGRSKI